MHTLHAGQPLLDAACDSSTSLGLSTVVSSDGELLLNAAVEDVKHGSMYNTWRRMSTQD